MIFSEFINSDWLRGFKTYNFDIKIMIDKSKFINDILEIAYIDTDTWIKFNDLHSSFDEEYFYEVLETYMKIPQDKIQLKGKNVIMNYNDFKDIAFSKEYDDRDYELIWINLETNRILLELDTIK